MEKVTFEIKGNKCEWNFINWGHHVNDITGQEKSCNKDAQVAMFRAFWGGHKEI